MGKHTDTEYNFSADVADRTADSLRKAQSPATCNGVSRFGYAACLLGKHNGMHEGRTIVNGTMKSFAKHRADT